LIGGAGQSINNSYGQYAIGQGGTQTTGGTAVLVGTFTVGDLDYLKLQGSFGAGVSGVAG
jgi:hypothetical protein